MELNPILCAVHLSGVAHQRALRVRDMRWQERGIRERQKIGQDSLTTGMWRFFLKKYKRAYAKGSETFKWNLENCDQCPALSDIGLFNCSLISSQLKQPVGLICESCWNYTIDVFDLTRNRLQLFVVNWRVCFSPANKQKMPALPPLYSHQGRTLPWPPPGLSPDLQCTCALSCS